MKIAGSLPEIELPGGTCAIADLHLDPPAARSARDFADWLGRLQDVPVLIVLGDLFEYWFGAAQARDAGHELVLAALRERARAGTALHFLHGNRDFLLGRAFERAVEGRVHPLGLVGTTARGARVLFLHGDELATRDRSYQRLRRLVRSPPLRGAARALPAAAGRALARALRRRSTRAVAAKSPATVELQLDAAAAWVAHHRAEHLVCGHAHRFREERLPLGARWTVLDAFGGARDLLRVTAGGTLEAVGSRAAEPTD